MDLYEALKSGVSEDELLKGFNKDLTEAKEKITKEIEIEIEKEKAEKEAQAEKARKASLAEYRHEVAAALCDYLRFGLNVLDTNEYISQTEKEIEDILKEFEKNLDSLSFFIRWFDKRY